MKGIVYNEEFLNFFEKKFKENIRGSNIDDQILFYENNLKTETRSQLKKLYNLQEDRHKCEFYVFLIKEFGKFELEFIIDNIFFEPKSKELFGLFKLIGLLPDDFDANENRPFLNSIYNFDFQSAANELDFCINELSECADVNLNKLNSNSNEYPVINLLVDLLLNDMKNNVKDLTKNIKLSVKILNFYNMLPQQDNTRAILLFNRLCYKIDLELSNNFFLDLDKLDMIIHNCFSEFFCLKLTELWDFNYYKNQNSKGLNKQIERYVELKKYLNSIKKIKITYSRFSFFEIFKEINKVDDENLHHLLYSNLKRRITDCILPSNSDLSEISRLALNGFGQKIRNELFQKIYYY